MKRIEKSDEGIRIELSKGQWALIDESDLALIAQYRWYASPRKTGAGYYAMTKQEGKTTYMHRLILQPPQGRDTDHVNGNTLDNRRSNLRVATRAQNMENRRGANANSTTGIRGVHVHHTIKNDRKKPTSKTELWSYNARIMVKRKSYTKNFPFTPEGLASAEKWVTEMRHLKMEFS